jgi:glycosyltransferase involved in cell wall biosynthesis
MIFMPLITVAVPVYNGENYLRECLASILKQEYKNFEIIVVDDGSKNENSIREIVESFRSEKIVFFRQTNGGVASALNLVIREMKGEYLAWLSHDDLFNEEKLKIQVDYLRQNMDDNEILYSGYEIIDEKGHLRGEVDFSLQVEKCQRIGGLERGLINGCSILISKEIINQVGFFDESLRYTQDYDYWLRCVQANKTFKYIPRTLIKTRIHSEQDSNQHHKLAHMEAEKLWLGILDLWMECESDLLNVNIRQMLEFRAFLANAGFSLAEQELSNLLLSYVSEFHVSVIIPISNRTYLLQIALNSLKSQMHKNFEVIIVNDAPGSYSEIQSILDEHRFPIKYLENVKNLGAGESRNIGIKNASGDFVCFLDSDDFFLPDKLSEQLFLMLATQAEISHTSYFARSSLNTPHTFNDTSHHSGGNQVQFIATHGCSIATPTVMIKKSLLAKIPNPFPKSHSAGEDISAWLTLLNASSGPLQHLMTPLTIVRTHVNSAANNTRAQIESKILINQTLEALGIEGITKIKSDNRIKSHLLFRFLEFILRIFTQIYLHMPLQIRSFLKNNRCVNYLYKKLQ